MIKPTWIIAWIILLAACSQTSKKQEVPADGTRVIKEYHSNGKLKSEISARGKLRHGESKEYRRDGTLESLITYENNRKHGPAKSFYPDGETVKTEVLFENGFKHGDSKWYFPDGTLYRLTPYFKGWIEGIRKVYYENGNLQAEIPYNRGEPGIGLREYNSSGNPKEMNTTIVFREQDRINLDNTFRLIITLSDGSQDVEFFQGELTDGKYWNKGLQKIPTEDGTGILEFYVSKGMFKMQTLNIVARIKTPLNNYHITQRTYHLAVENKH
jgi:hypothetical protein